MTYYVAAFFLLFQQLLVNDLVDGINRRYARINDLSADFVHISKDFSNRTAIQRGHVYLKSGKRALFKYVSPEEKSEYFDGKTYTKYTPAFGQAIQRPIGKDEDTILTVFQIVGNRESPWKDHYSTWTEPKVAKWKEGNRLVQLLPNRSELPQVLVEVDPGSFLIYRFVFTYEDGESEEFRFENIETAPLSPSLFQFQPPPGVEVISDR